MRGRIHPRNLLRFICLAISVTLLQCGKKSKSQDVGIYPTPTNPIVITSDLTYTQNGNQQTVQGPWFQFTVIINNHSDSKVVFVALHIEVTGTDANGAPVVNMVDFSPGTWSYSLTDSNGNSISCDYADFGEFGNGDPSTDPTNNISLYMASTVTGCPTLKPLFYVGSNPKMTGNAYNYMVKVQPQGWFGSRTTQTDRFNGYTTITTR